MKEIAMEIMKAHRQWATRPADERYPDLQSLYNATKKMASESAEAMSPLSRLRVEPVGEDLALVGKTKIPAVLTNWSFAQICKRVAAPAGYLEALPATLAAQNINHGLEALSRQENLRDANLLFGIGKGSLELRSLMTDCYSRIWNYEIVERLMVLQDMGWEPAMPDIRKTASDFPALYASDRDMFGFVRNRRASLSEPGHSDSLQRGVIVENSEVGASSLKLTRFLYREMCGNHIIWGASQVFELNLRHINGIRGKFGMYAAELKKYAESSATDEEAKISSAKRKTIAANKDELLDKLFGIKSLNLSRKTLEAGYDAVNPDQDGDPRTVWGLVQGLTRHSQTLPYADRRTEIDTAAGKILQIEF
jgi:hypothetical protein